MMLSQIIVFIRIIEYFIGVYLYAIFDIETNRGGRELSNLAFLCDKLFLFDGADSSQCSWLSNQLVLISLGPVSLKLLQIGSVFTLKTRTLFAAEAIVSATPASLIQYNHQMNVSISEPYNPIAPVVTLSSPAQVFQCDGISLDPTGTYGSAGRAWVSVSWSVTGETSPGTWKIIYDTSALESFLNTRFNSTGSIVIIPNDNSLLNTGDYVFTIKVTNFFKVSSILSKTVRVVRQQDLPQIVIDGPSVINMNRVDKLSLFATASVMVCGKAIDDSIDFDWYIYQGLRVDATIKSISRDARYFKLHEYALEANTNYAIKATASLSKDKKLAASSIVYVNVGVSGVKSIIEGGASRTEIVSNTIKLDASKSVNLDYPDSKDDLSFTWECIEYSPSYGSTCPDSLVSNLNPESINIIPANTIDISDTIVVSITVIVSNKLKLSDSSNVLLTLTKKQIPTVSIISVDAKFNYDDKIVISGIVTVPRQQTASGVWTANGIEESKLNSMCLTSRTRTFPSSSAIIVSTFQLILAPKSLAPGALYTFILSVEGNGETSSSSVSVQINSPPIGGYVKASPSSGRALNTTFLIFTTSWADDASDYPLSYGIYYYTINPLQLTTLKPSNEGSSIKTTLGEGPESKNYSVTCVAIVNDLYMSSGRAEQEVQVLPMVTAVAELGKVFDDLVTLALKTKNAEGIGLMVTGVMTSISKVDCSKSPKCSSLNRNNCSTTVNTCGSCLPGFIGKSGDSNSICSPKYTSQRRLDSLSDHYDSTNSMSSLSSRLNKFNFKSNDISESLKECRPANCSGHGTCLFYGADDEPISTCYATTFTCQAQCKCEDDWFGSDCSKSLADLESLRSVKDNLCKTLYGTKDMQDMSENLMKERSQKIISILSDPNAVTISGLTNCTYLLLDTVEYGNYQLAAKNNDVVYSAFSVVLQSDFYKMLPITLTHLVVRAIKKIAITRQSILSIGEPDTPFIDSNGNDFFRVFVKNDYLGSYENTQIKAASSDLEINRDISVSSVTLLKSYDNSIPLDQSLGLYILQFSRDVVGIKNYLSSNSEKNWSYIFFSYEMPSDQKLERNITAVLSIDTYEGVNFTTGYENIIQGKHVCDASKSSQVIKCPMQSFNVDCEGITGYVNYNCSTYSRVPTCEILKTENSDATCELESYSNEYVNCKCTSSIPSNSNSVNFPVVSQTIPKYSLFSQKFIPTYPSAMPTLSPIKSEPTVEVEVIVSLKIKGLTRDLMNDVEKLKLVLRESLSITLNIPLVTIKDPIIEEIAAVTKKQLTNYINLLQSILINVQFVIVSGLSSNQVSQNFNASTFTSSLSSKASGVS